MYENQVSCTENLYDSNRGLSQPLSLGGGGERGGRQWPPPKESPGYTTNPTYSQCPHNGKAHLDTTLGKALQDEIQFVR